MAKQTVIVYGPAYLDRVLRVDGPLADPPMDLSCEGRVEPGVGLRLVDPDGNSLRIGLPEAWPGPFGAVHISRAFEAAGRVPSPQVQGVSWLDDLGGMGAGFAAALGGRLISALGPRDEAVTGMIGGLLRRYGVEHEPDHLPDRSADWTLLLSSGRYGDKLPIGFRGCHAGWNPMARVLNRPADVRVVAGLPNRLAARILSGSPSGIRVFAPALRNAIDRDPPVSSFAGSFDVLCCNRQEWEAFGEQAGGIAATVALRSVTDGMHGVLVAWRESGRTLQVQVPAYPRDRPPRDTNRAGETFAANLIRGLLGIGWKPGASLGSDEMEAIARRATAAAALVLDLETFGFPGQSAIDAALEAGRVA